MWDWFSKKDRFRIQMLAKVDSANDKLAAMTTSAESIARSLRIIAESQQDIVKLLKRAVGAPNPGSISIVYKGEDEMARLKFDVALPAWPAGDEVVSGELTTVIGGVSNVVPVAKGDAAVVGLVGDQDAAVELSFVYVDNAGLKSANPSTFSAVLVDTIPPPDAGALGITVTGEES